MKFKELPAGRIGMLLDEGRLFGRTVANIAGNYYILDAYDHVRIPAGSPLVNLEIRLVGDYNENVCDAISGK